jgi:outer membrane protein
VQRVFYRQSRFCLIGLGFFSLSAGPLNSATLSQALIAAYANNATLRSSRAHVEAASYKIPEARSGFLPKVTATGLLKGNTRRLAFDVNPNDVPSFLSPLPGITGQTSSVPTVLSNQNNPYINRIASITLDQTLYDSGRTQANFRFAQAQTAQAYALLSATEQQILLAAVSAYMDVVRLRAILKLREADIRALTEQNRQVYARLAVGELTETDSAQSEAARAEAHAARELTVADLQSAEAFYQQIIGQNPDALNGLSSSQRLAKKPVRGLKASRSLSSQCSSGSKRSSCLYGRGNRCAQ